jgi:flagellar basal-body rod protein FlgF
MNTGLHLSASGVLANLYRQDVFANNLANMGTVGFKRDLAMITQRAPESLEDPHPFGLQNDLLDRLGGGVFAGPQQVAFKQGAMQKTDNALDVALDGKDTFFVASVIDPTTKEQAIRLTRDGRFETDLNGMLVMIAGGNPILDENDQTIQVDRSQPVEINREGEIRQNQQLIAKLQIARAADNKRLLKSGSNLFRFEDGQDQRVVATSASVRSGYVEMSTVDPFTELRAMLDATSAVQSNGNLIKYHDMLMDRTVNTLGRVVG